MKIILVLLLALFLRLINIDQSFWLDEAITAENARDYSFSELYTNYLPWDNSPPLFLFLIKSLFSILPNTDFVARVPSILFGLGTVYFTFLIAKKWNGENFGILVAFLLASSPLHIYFSQEARMYSMTAFLATLIIWGLLNYLDKKKNLFLTIYVLATILLIYTHYVPALLFLAINLLMFNLKKFNKKWFLAQLVIVIAYIPWLPAFFGQLQVGIEGRGISENFDKILGKFDFKTFPLVYEKFVLGKIPVDENWTVILIITALILFGVLLLLGILKSDRNIRKLLFFWLLLPSLLTALISFKIPLFQYHRLLFVLPAFYLLLGLGINSLKIWKVALISVLVVNFFAVYLYHTNPVLQREQWKQSINWVESNLQEKDQVFFASGDPFAPYLWYRKIHPEANGAFAGFYINETDRYKTEFLLQDKKRVFLYTYLQDITDPERKLQRWIVENNFKKTSSKSFIGVGEVQIYER